jgi:hypothetical protein
MPSAGLMEMDRIQPSSEPVSLACFAFQNATKDERRESVHCPNILARKSETQARTLLLDEDLSW